MKYLSASKTVKKEKATVSWLDEICWFGIVGIGFNLFESFAYMFTTIQYALSLLLSVMDSFHKIK